MKKIIFVILIALLLFSCKEKETKIIESVKVEDDNTSTSKLYYPLEEGMELTDLSIETNKGTTFDLNIIDKPVLINFWATWCPPCRMEMPGLQNIYEKYKDRVEFVMINLGETNETISDFLIENETYTFPIGYDESGYYGLKYAIVSIPTTIILDKNKIIKHYLVGARDEKEFEECLNDVLNE